MLIKDQSFAQKPNFCSKIEILPKKFIFYSKTEFFCSKTKIWRKNRHFDPRSNICSKVELLLNEGDCGEKLKFNSKIERLLKIELLARKKKLKNFD